MIYQEIILMVDKTASKFARLKKKAGKPAGISEKSTRLLEIYTLIAQNKFPSIDSLVDRYGVSKRTIYRYFEVIDFTQRRKLFSL